MMTVKTEPVGRRSLLRRAKRWAQGDWEAVLLRWVMSDHPFLGRKSAGGGGSAVVDGRAMADGLYGYAVVG